MRSRNGLSNNAIHILIGISLSCRKQMGKIEGRFQCPRNILMICKILPIVCCDGVNMIRKWLPQVDNEGISAVLKYFLLAVNRQGNIGNILWAPDGNWLLIDHSWNIPNKPCIKTLVNVDICQIISIADLGGSAIGWLP